MLHAMENTLLTLKGSLLFEVIKSVLQNISFCALFFLLHSDITTYGHLYIFDILRLFSVKDKGEKYFILALGNIFAHEFGTDLNILDDFSFNILRAITHTVISI